MSISANIWPLPLLAVASFFADPLPTPAPANDLFGEECGCCQVTRCTSPPATLAQEVLTLGAIVGEANRVISAAEEETVTVGILLPATTRDMQDGDPTTKGWSSPLSPDKPTTPGLAGMENDALSDWESKGYILGTNDFKGHPVMGSRLYSMGAPITG